MNRALFITIGIVVIIFAFIVWLYLFLNGSPIDTNQVFSDLGIIEARERNIDPVSSLDTNRGTTLNLTDGTIQQITTEPVAGFGVASSSAGPLLRYVERGTGYIQEVNLRSGLKNQITPQTTPGAIAAHFSPELDKLTIASQQQNEIRLALLDLPPNAGGEVSITGLPENADNIWFLDETTLFYTRGNFIETTGYRQNTETGDVGEDFKVKLPQAGAVVGRGGEYYVYPKPTAALKGGAYMVSGSNLSPLGEMARGIIPFVESPIKVLTQINEDSDTYESRTTPNDTLLAVAVFPEKCAADPMSNRIWCGIPSITPDEDYLEHWYKGLIVSDDSIAEIDTLTGEATVISIPKNDTGRQVDITELTYETQTGRLLFINKIDATLWSLDL